MNVFTFNGNLGADVEVKQTQGGTTVASFPVAVSSGFGDNKKTTWVRCALFGKRAEGNLIQYLVKGTKVAVSGEMTHEQWQNQAGENKSAVKVSVDKIDLIGDKPASQGQYGQANNQQQSPQAPPVPNGGGGDFDMDIPFNGVDARAW